MMSKKKFYYLFGYLFLFFSFYSVYFVRHNLDENSLFIFLFITLICISTDIGGFIFGKIFKGPKLTKISPNKTYSGVIGSFILPVIAGLVYTNHLELPLGIIVQLKLSEISNNYELTFLFFILTISIISQIGDLIISYFKRLSKVKDTGKILPGHGGILDRVDGLIFVIPILYLFIIL